MRELFRASVRDGDISETERLVLQNVATLLSQVDGNTWVNFADTQGAVRELTPQQLKRLRPFLDSVAQELREHEVHLSSLNAHNEEVLDCIKLARVPWADGITALELLNCCGPEDKLMCAHWLEGPMNALPSQFMLRPRVRELLNYYHIKYRAAASQKRSLLQRAEDRHIPGAAALASGLRCSCAALVRFASVTVHRVVAPLLRLCVSVFSAACSVVSDLVVAFATAVVDVVSFLIAVATPASVRTSKEPFWPAIRFFCAAILHGQSRRLFKVLVLIASWRVILCLAVCTEFFGWLFHPAVWVAQKVLHWNQSSTVWGCSCNDRAHPSILSWVPITVADHAMWMLKLVRFVPLPDVCTEQLLRALDFLHPAVAFLCDLTFSIGIARGLAVVVDLADEQAQQRLVWMSMNIARIIREAPLQADPDSPEAQERAITGNSEPEVAPEVAPKVEASALPQWNEEATWNLFDTE